MNISILAGHEDSYNTSPAFNAKPPDILGFDIAPGFSMLILTTHPPTAGSRQKILPDHQLGMEKGLGHILDGKLIESKLNVHKNGK